jgi:hypothetical protein
MTQPTKNETPVNLPLRNGHEKESSTEHLGNTASDEKDGFGNVLWDNEGPREGTVTIEEKIPPAF